MKKFFAMFAFAATIVLGAFTLASCDNEIENPAFVRHRFALEAKLTPSKTEYQAEVADLEKEVNAVLDKFNAQEFRTPMTEGEASTVWMTVNNQLGDAFQLIANKAWTKLRDKDFVLTIIMREDGEHVFHEQPYKPNNWIYDL